jgi:hypothetical protein
MYSNAGSTLSSFFYFLNRDGSTTRLPAGRFQASRWYPLAVLSFAKNSRCIELAYLEKSGEGRLGCGEGEKKRAATGQASRPVKLQSPGKGHRVQSLLERGHGRPVFTLAD